MNFNLFETYCRLSKAFGPSGREEGIRTALCKLISESVPDADRWAHRVDSMGNLLYHKSGTGKKILLAAHMDSIGVVVTHIDDKGFARVAQIGGIMLCDLINRTVRFENGTRGVLSFEDKTDFDKLGRNNLFLDIGAASREDAEKFIHVGDFAVFCGEYFAQGDVICGPYLDNRIGCLTLVDAMSRLSDTANDVTVAFTVQEEVGLRGAQTAAFGVNADIAIAVDVTDTGDLPERKYPMAVQLGGGPAIKVMDRSVICDTGVTQALHRAADALGIPVQREIMEFGGTDTGVIQRSQGGVRVGAVSIPTRYIHAACELAHVHDIDQCGQLIAQAVCSEL